VSFLQALAGLGLLLLLGLGLRLSAAVLRRLLLPASVLGGFVGLALGPYAFDVVPPDVVVIWGAVPGVLINFVFAGLFLGAALPGARALVEVGGPLFRFGMVGALGQYGVGLALTGLVLAPVFGVPDLFACVLEVGFAGGHGTAAAMTPVFEDLGFAAGGALGQMAATVGIVVGVVSGMMLVQWGVGRGHTQLVGSDDVQGGAGAPETRGFVPKQDRVAVAMGTVRPGVLDPLSYHLAIVSVAVGLGWVGMSAVRAVHPALSSFPLFPLAMIGGIGVQFAADRLGVAATFDRATFQRIMGVSLDLLIVAAIAALRLDLFLQYVAPFTLLMVAGVVWCVGSFLVLAPRMLRRDWFEQGITIYGTQTGVTAVGLMLLRIVDPENETTAAEAFAARAMVASPLVGGGLVTAAMPLFVESIGVWSLFGLCVGACALFVAWPLLRRLVGFSSR